MPLDHYVTLGKSGLRVSPLCLGTMTFGLDWGFGSSVDESFDVLKKYLELGGNFIDTANFYTRGHSEKIIGDFLAQKHTRRDRLVIATKFFSNMFTGDPNGGGASRKSIISACDNSLKRMRSDYIDLYWLHCWDKFTPIEETMSALNDLVTAGKVRYIGFSDTPAWKTCQAQMIALQRGWAPLIALQIEYSLLERTVEGELIPMALEMGLGVTPWSPLKGGILTGKYRREDKDTADPSRGEWTSGFFTDKVFDLVDVVRSVADELGTTPARVSLAWLQRKPGVTSSIIGARTLKQLEDNVAALELVLAPEQIAKLDAASKPVLNFPADFVANIGPFGYGGATINGTTYAPNSLAPLDDAERYEEVLAKV
ncbi:MAG: aldo/keto reductase [Cyanobacteria bacterium]|nr:aldo/keto reductase [Cyanobacteriota bacterium]